MTTHTPDASPEPLESSWIVAEARRSIPPAPAALASILGSSAATAALRARIHRAARSQANVLIEGESGTGKELVARAIHALSERAAQPLVVIQCGTIPDSIAASELFGHERGAFTDARAPRRGRFETADGGTVFLDEVGDLSPQVQVHILRTIQFGEIARVGSDRTHRIDVRVVAATHRPLAQMVAEGSFRQDLYWRLHELPISVPALRDRPDDVALLARAFLERANERERRAIPGLSPDALAALERHDWPGNVRELEHRVRRAVIEAPHEGLLDVEAFDLPRLAEREGDDESRFEAHMADAEIELISRALALASGNRTRAAAALGVSRRTLQKKMVRLGLR